MITGLNNFVNRLKSAPAARVPATEPTDATVAVVAAVVRISARGNETSLPNITAVVVSGLVSGACIDGVSTGDATGISGRRGIAGRFLTALAGLSDFAAVARAPSSLGSASSSLSRG